MLTFSKEKKLKISHTQRLLPFFRGYVLVPNAFFLFDRSSSSPLIPLFKSDFRKPDKPLT